LIYTRIAIILGILVYAFCIFLIAIGIRVLLSPVVGLSALVFLVGAGNYFFRRPPKGPSGDQA
jgi:hypothetical protein